MSITILDGSPWYLSPDIWVVPGEEPEGAPGIPSPGNPAFVWCRIHNDGPEPVEGVVVDFYWANPSTVITRESATHIGRSYATADPGSVEVLCVTPWVPTLVNNGHECLIVEISETGPPPPSSVPFNPPAEPHVAQRNLTLATLGGERKHFTLPFVAGEGTRGVTTLVVERGKLSQISDLAERAGIPAGLKEAEEISFGLLPAGSDPCERSTTDHELHLQEPQAPILQVTAPKLPRGRAALLLVEEREGERVVGGLAVLALNAGPS